VLVPWNATNREHKFSIRIQRDDSQEVLFGMDGMFNVGRPAHLHAGDDQRSIIAPAQIPILVNEAGAYVLSAIVNDRDSKKVQFRVSVATLPGVAQMQQPPTPH